MANNNNSNNNTFTVHTSLLFDPKKRAFVENVSIGVDRESGAIISFSKRADTDTPLSLDAGDVDLRGKVVMPGFVDSHTHVFLHAYTYRLSSDTLVYI
jgi:predicted amidohydrolase YtcJ